jgi:hypothetical protein
VGATVKVHAPAGDTVNEQVGGVNFHKGVADVDRSDTAALAYFRRHGYLIEGEEPPAEDGRVDARDAGTTKVGTPLRDGAVDPRPGDFLPPTNAGLADPHGPLVVAPGIHGVEPGPIVPGVVPSQPEVQEAKETAAAEQELVVDDQVAEVSVPAKSASKPAWVAYAVHSGADVETAEKTSKAKLIEQYAPKED